MKRPFFGNAVDLTWIKPPSIEFVILSVLWFSKVLAWSYQLEQTECGVNWHGVMLYID